MTRKQWVRVEIWREDASGVLYSDPEMIPRSTAERLRREGADLGTDGNATATGGQQ